MRYAADFVVTHTHRQNDYRNPMAHAPRVNNQFSWEYQKASRLFLASKMVACLACMLLKCDSEREQSGRHLWSTSTKGRSEIGSSLMPRLHLQRRKRVW